MRQILWIRRIQQIRWIRLVRQVWRVHQVRRIRRIRVCIRRTRVLKIAYLHGDNFTVMNSVTRILFTETLVKSRIVKYWLTLYLSMYLHVSIKSNVLYIPPRFLVFHIPLIFAL